MQKSLVARSDVQSLTLIISGFSCMDKVYPNGCILW